MKIAVATDDFEHVSGHVGRCKGFLVLEVENGKIISREERPNTFTHHKIQAQGEGGSHGHSHKRTLEALSDCDNLICQSAGWRLIEDLKTANIVTVFTSVTDAATAAVKLEQGELEINEEGSCRSH